MRDALMQVRAEKPVQDAFMQVRSEKPVQLDEAKKVTKKERDRLEDQNEHGLLALKLAQAIYFYQVQLLLYRSSARMVYYHPCCILELG